MDMNMNGWMSVGVGQIGVVFDLGRVQGEEVFLQGDTDFEQEVGADTFSRKNVVDVGTVTTQLLRQPQHTVALTQQFVMNFTTNINACFPHQSLNDKYVCATKLTKYQDKDLYSLSYFA